MTIIERSAQIYDLQTDTTVETKDVVEYTNAVKETGMTPDEIGGALQVVNKKDLQVSKFVIIGNSLVAPNSNPAGSFAEQFCALSSGRAILVANKAVGGRKSANVLAAIAADLDDYVGEATHVIYHEGSNDALLSVSASTHISNVQSIIENIQSRGFIPVVVASATFGASNASAIHLIEKYRYLERKLCADRGVKFLDPWFAISGSNGEFNVTNDGTHPDAFLHNRLADVCVSQFYEKTNALLLPLSNSNAAGILRNNALNTSNTWTVLSGVSVTKSVTAGAGNVRGNWANFSFVDQLPDATYGFTYIYKTIPAPVVGRYSNNSEFDISGFFKFTNISNARIAVRFWVDADINQSYYLCNQTDSFDETFFHKRIKISVTNATSIHFGVQIYPINNSLNYSADVSIAGFDAYSGEYI